MAADTVLSRELKSLQDELSLARRERAARGDIQISPKSSDAAAADAWPQEPAEQAELRSQLGELIKEITAFAEDAEKNIAAHPAMSVAAAMLLGILIGSLLARR